jgi:hypothetical protein
MAHLNGMKTTHLPLLGIGIIDGVLSVGENVDDKGKKEETRLFHKPLFGSRTNTRAGMLQSFLRIFDCIFAALLLLYRAVSDSRGAIRQLAEAEIRPVEPDQGNACAGKVELFATLRFAAFPSNQFFNYNLVKDENCFWVCYLLVSQIICPNQSRYITELLPARPSHPLL